MCAWRVCCQELPEIDEGGVSLPVSEILVSADLEASTEDKRTALDKHFKTE